MGWPSIVAMCEDLSGIDLRELEVQTSAFLGATEDGQASHDGVSEVLP